MPPVFKVTGGGQVPGNNGQGSATFGLNVRRTTAGVSGHINVYDHGTGQHIQSLSISSANKTAGNQVSVLGTCSVDNGPAMPCEVTALDRATPGRGEDEFHIRVGPTMTPIYTAGGTLERGNVQVR